MEAKNKKYSDLSLEELSSKFEFQLFGHVPDTANEWDFYPVVSAVFWLDLILTR